MSKRKTIEEFIIDARLVHGELYDYSLVKYLNSKSENKVVIICEKHGNFEQNSRTHLQGSGCSKCASSKGESVIRNYLESNNIGFTEQKSFEGLKMIKKLRFDFYLSEYNLAIEYDGRQHFEPVEYFGGVKSFKEIIKRDLIKNEYCFDNNITLLRIPYTDLKNIDKILNINL